jgi:hypothetical protein
LEEEKHLDENNQELAIPAENACSTATRYLFVAKKLLDKRYGFELQHNNVAALTYDWTCNFWKTFAALKSPKRERGKFG